MKLGAIVGQQSVALVVNESELQLHLGVPWLGHIKALASSNTIAL